MAGLRIYFLPTSVFCYYLYKQLARPDLDPTDDIPEIIFQKSFILKKISR